MYGIRSTPARLIALILLALGAVSLAAATAAAHDNGGAYKTYGNDRHWHHYDKRYWKRHGHAGVTVFAWKPVGGWPSYGYRRMHSACHGVVGHGYDHFGRRATFGGTMCYDRAGRGYVVPGSRYVIRYF